MLTATEIIAQGNYLEKDFDPQSLTVSQLLGVLSFHDIPYPTPYSKPKLVQVFNNSIKPNISKFKRERSKKESSIASDDGIMDGITGEPIGANRKVPVRRSSRRLSRPPSEEPPQRDPPKRRRSAEPRLGGARNSKLILNDPVLVEESEPDDEDELPVRKVGRSKKASQAGTQSRRVSHADDSGWEENNIFQSGAESSSPARASPGSPRKARKTSRMSAPPQLSPPSSPFPPPIRKEPLFPVQSKFDPHLSPEVKLETKSMTQKFREPTPVNHSPVNFQIDFKPRDQSPVLGNEDENNIEQGDFIVDDDEVETDQEIDESDTQLPLVSQVQSIVSNEDDKTSWARRLSTWLLVLLLAAAIIDYKLESAPLGYCDSGRNTNKALEDLRARRLAIDECNKHNRTLLHPRGSELCPPQTLNPLPRPDACTPCPDHAECTRDTVTCAKGYLLQSPLPLFFLPAVPTRSDLQLTYSSSPAELAWKIISIVFDGLPGMGPVAFPPRCKEDPRRKRNIGVLGKAVEALLAQKRGQRVCSRESNEKDRLPERDGGEGKQWGIELSELRSMMRAKTAVSISTQPIPLLNIF